MMNNMQDILGRTEPDLWMEMKTKWVDKIPKKLEIGKL
jgi:hypothetical protein